LKVKLWMLNFGMVLLGIGAILFLFTADDLEGCAELLGESRNKISEEGYQCQLAILTLYGGLALMIIGIGIVIVSFRSR